MFVKLFLCLQKRLPADEPEDAAGESKLHPGDRCQLGVWRRRHCCWEWSPGARQPPRARELSIAWRRGAGLGEMTCAAPEGLPAQDSKAVCVTGGPWTSIRRETSLIISTQPSLLPLNPPPSLTPGSLLPTPHIPKAAPVLWASRGSGVRSTQTTVRTMTVRTTPPV